MKTVEIDVSSSFVPPNTKVRLLGISRTDLDSLKEFEIGLFVICGGAKDALRAKKTLDSIISNMKNSKGFDLRTHTIFYTMPCTYNQKVKEDIRAQLESNANQNTPWVPCAGTSRGKVSAEVAQ